MANYTLKIVEIRKETDDTVSVIFKQPTLRKVKYKSGQYLTLIFKINGRRYLRPYSFSSCPETDKDIIITVKRVSGGIVSNHICDMLKIGDCIEALPPMGNFCIQEDVFSDTYCFWGAGSGITPLISIIKFLLSTTNVRIVLTYGNREKNTVVFYEEIKQLTLQYKNRFKVIYYFSQEKSQNCPSNSFQGRISPDCVNIILKQNEIAINASHFICGPQGLKDSVKQSLSAFGVPNNLIYSEDFELTRNPQDFEDILTQTVSIIFNNYESKIEVTKGKSILDAALDSGLDIPYSCQTGTCKECRAEIMQGNIKMVGVEETNLCDLQVNECLLCCSHPKSENIVLKIQ